jgi:hypothetical protein
MSSFNMGWDGMAMVAQGDGDRRFSLSKFWSKNI